MLLMLCGDIESNPGPTLGNGNVPNAASLIGIDDLSEDLFDGIDLDYEYAIDDAPEQNTEEENAAAFAAAIAAGFPHEAEEGADSDIRVLETILGHEGNPSGNDGPRPEPVSRNATKKYTYTVLDTVCETCEAQFENFVLLRKHANSCKAPWAAYAHNPNYAKCGHCHAPIARQNLARHNKSFHSPEALAATRAEYSKKLEAIHVLPPRSEWESAHGCTSCDAFYPNCVLLKFHQSNCNGSRGPVAIDFK